MVRWGPKGAKEVEGFKNTENIAQKTLKHALKMSQCNLLYPNLPVHFVPSSMLEKAIKSAL